MSRQRASAPLVLALLWVALLGSGCRRRATDKPKKAEAAQPTPVKILYPPAPGSFVKLVRQLNASVVHLRTDLPVRGGPADWFPSAPAPQSPLVGELTERMQRSLGSGVLIDAEGYVLTTAHVVARADKLLARLHDGTDVKAKLVGRDEATDLALLKLALPQATKVKPARLGDSDQLQPGEWVVAVGNPFGMGPLVSAGLVSSRGKGGGPLGQKGYWGLIQTDAQITPGNSGGPLCSVIGEVVGINAAVESEPRGIGFAVPINVAKRIVPMLRRDGKVARAWVGIYMDKLEPERAKQLKLDSADGALVTGVVPRGPAGRAGLRRGDVILEFDGKRVVRHQDLPWLAALSGVGRMVQVKVWRDGKRQTFTLKTERMPE